MNRRSFLKASSGAALGGLAWMATGCASESDSSASSASAADTSAAGTRSLPALGVQLYTVRSLMEDDFEGTLQSVADIGFDHVEFAGYYERSPEEVRALLDDLGLAAPSTHVPLEPLRNDLDGVIQTAQAVGHEYVICPWLPEEERASIANYRALAQFFNEVGGQMRDAGLQFGYHNHAFEFEAIDGTRPYDVLLDETDPEHVTMELDLYWIREAGFDPLAYFADHPGRFALAHVKDRADDGTMLPVGQGAIDFAAIFAQSEQAGLQHYVVEHDNPDDPLASIRTSHDYLRQLRF
jgi:sugar phosphate isomerase/epimerase